MTRSQIEYILALNKFKNFGLAAEACFISQSTLSAMVAKFEENTGVEIFNRKMRPISVTPQGEKVLKSLKSIYREYQLLDENLNAIKGIEIGTFSIACIPTVAPYLYPLILNRLSSLYPKINFIINELTTESIEDEIENGMIDIGIISPPLDNKELLVYPLYEEQFYIYDYGKSIDNKKKYQISDIDFDRLWLLEEGHCMRNQVKQICELRQLKKMKSNIIYSCGSIFTLAEMVKKNNGVTLIPQLALIDNKQIDLSKVFKITNPVPQRKIGLVTHKHFIKKRLLKSIANIIIEVVQNHLKKNILFTDN